MGQLIHEQIKFQRLVQPLEKVRILEDVYFSGKITSVTVHFPSGCEHYVDVAFGHGKVSLFPRDDYIALDDVTQVWYYAEPYSSQEELWTEILNGDGINPHYIACVVQIQGELA